MTSFNEFLNEQLKDPKFKSEYEKLEPEFTIIQALIEARKSQNITQKQLAEKSGINQADISRLENGNANPTLRMLQRLASGMNMDVKIEFVPKQSHI